MTDEPLSSQIAIPDPLSDEERKILLALARRSIERAVNEQTSLELDLESYSNRLREPGATFVTLTDCGELRGCVGTLEAYQTLVQDVCEHAVAAALEDYRFLPVAPEEVSRLSIEISRLTQPQPVVYETPEDLLKKLRPMVDGVILRDGLRRATFLPQVWEKIPDAAAFLDHLCQKMGGPSSLWRRKPLTVAVYQVEEFHE